MHHSQSYPVTVQVNPPQPHVTYEPKSSLPCSGWLPFTLAGVTAVAFMICIHMMGGKRIFLEVIDPTDGLVPIVKQGALRVYPFLSGSENGIESFYTTELPPSNTSEAVRILDELLKSYPERHGRRYRNCWLENPAPDHPCFFDSSWVKQLCTHDDSYGYQARDGLYSPCFVLKLEDTENWAPSFSSHIPDAIVHQYDPGFIPVHCFVKRRTVDSLYPQEVTVYPMKGFSHLFFPVNKFNSEKYLAPLVAVKVHGIQKKENVTVECSIYTPNSFLLWNNGKAVITFEAS